MLGYTCVASVVCRRTYSVRSSRTTIASAQANNTDSTALDKGRVYLLVARFELWTRANNVNAVKQIVPDTVSKFSLSWASILKNYFSKYIAKTTHAEATHSPTRFCFASSMAIAWHTNKMHQSTVNERKVDASRGASEIVSGVKKAVLKNNLLKLSSHRKIVIGMIPLRSLRRGCIRAHYLRSIESRDNSTKHFGFV